MTACGNGTAEPQPGSLNPLTAAAGAPNINAGAGPGQSWTQGPSASSGGAKQPAGATPGGGSTNQPNSQSGAATFDGFIDGDTFKPNNAIFAIGPGPDGQVQLAIKISDQPDDCSAVNMQAHKAGGKSLWIHVRGRPMGSTTVTLGGSLDSAYASFYALDAGCHNTIPPVNGVSQKGVVDLQIGDPNSMATGQYTLVMGPQGDYVAGTFAAAPCPGLLGLIANPPQMLSCE